MKHVNWQTITLNIERCSVLQHAMIFSRRDQLTCIYVERANCDSCAAALLETAL